MKKINYEMTQMEISQKLAGIQRLFPVIARSVESDDELEPVIKEVKMREELLREVIEIDNSRRVI